MDTVKRRILASLRVLKSALDEAIFLSGRYVPQTWIYHESMEIWRRRYEERFDEINARVATARKTLVASGYDVPDSWLVFDLWPKIGFDQNEAPSGKIFVVSPCYEADDEDVSQWKVIRDEVTAAEFRLRHRAVKEHCEDIEVESIDEHRVRWENAWQKKTGLDPKQRENMAVKMADYRKENSGDRTATPQDFRRSRNRVKKRQNQSQ